MLMGGKQQRAWTPLVSLGLYTSTGETASWQCWWGASNSQLVVLTQGNSQQAELVGAAAGLEIPSQLGAVH